MAATAPGRVLRREAAADARTHGTGGRARGSCGGGLRRSHGCLVVEHARTARAVRTIPARCSSHRRCGGTPGQGCGCAPRRRPTTWSPRAFSSTPTGPGRRSTSSAGPPSTTPWSCSTASSIIEPRSSRMCARRQTGYRDAVGAPGSSGRRARRRPGPLPARDQAAAVDPPLRAAHPDCAIRRPSRQALRLAEVDFGFPEYKLAVEYDGAWHGQPGQLTPGPRQDEPTPASRVAGSLRHRGGHARSRWADRADRRALAA